MSRVYAVIMAGGGGTRLWPLSTPECPKPFLPLFPGGKRHQTLFQKTIARILGPDLALDDITVVASGAYAELALGQVPGVRVLEEPQGRNTAAAIALAAVGIDRADDEVMIVLPADHLIAAEDLFRDVLVSAATDLATGSFGIADPLVTLGIEVDRPATEYGYLLPDLDRGSDVGGLRAYPLRAFEEKPDAARAVVLGTTPGVAWNAGMFLWRRGAIREAFRELAPDVFDPIADGWADGRLAEGYAAARAVSIDYAVMEPAAEARRVVMASMEVGWSDLGSWTVLLAALGGVGVGRVIQPGEAAEAGPDDLVVERVDGRLVLTDGPRGILAGTPVALLAGARPARDIVVQLLDRAARQEA
jgi:mannose-1-phosphate guanylyltransferase